MLLTHLYRPNDYTAYIRKGEAPFLPANVGGMVWMTAMNVPFQFFGIILFNGAAVILQLTVPYVIKLIIDRMSVAPEGLNGRMDYIMPAFVLLLLVIGGRFIAQYVVWTLSYFWRPGRRRMSHGINTYVLGHSPSFFENDLSGRIIQKSISLFGGTEQILSAILWNWSGTAFFFIVALAMLGAISLPLAGVGILWFALLFAGSRYIGRHIPRNARMTSESRSQLVGRRHESRAPIEEVWMGHPPSNCPCAKDACAVGVGCVPEADTDCPNAIDLRPRQRRSDLQTRSAKPNRENTGRMQGNHCLLSRLDRSADAATRSMRA